MGWLIKVGDWVTHNVTGERFEIIEYNDKYVWLRKGNGFRDITTHETLYKWLYEQQKQRADELQELIERFLYANKESDIYAIQNEEEFLNEYKQLTNK